MNLSVDKALKKANLHLRQNELLEARNLFESVLRAFPGNKMAQQGLNSLNKKNTAPGDTDLMQNKVNDLINLYNAGIFSKVVDESIILTQQYPDSFVIWNIMGAAAAQIDMLDLAIIALRKVIFLKPDHAMAYNNLGNALVKLDSYPEAIEAFKNAITIQPDNADALHNMSVAFRLQGAFEEAMEACDRVLRLEPRNASAHHNMGRILQNLGRPEEAIKAYQAAIQIKPDYAEAINFLGKCYWLNKDFVNAFKYKEWRWLANQNNIGEQFKSNKPDWAGEKSKNVFVWKEQGIGDELMFSSVLMDLGKESKNVVVECDSRLLSLYRRSFPQNIQFIKNRVHISEEDYDRQIAIGSLPKYLRQNLNDFKSSSVGWLSADAEKVKMLREKLRADDTDKIIGISWRTMAAVHKAKSRNIALSKLVECVGQTPAKFVSLQYGDVTEEVNRLNCDTGIKVLQIEEIDNFRDIDNLAALISACDLVISIDNFTVHLAGSLGIDTRVLLPRVADVRWGLNTNDSYWYDSLTLYRQEVQGDWSHPLYHILNDLME